jgi:hypothetical protein
MSPCVTLLSFPKTRWFTAESLPLLLLLLLLFLTSLLRVKVKVTLRLTTCLGVEPQLLLFDNYCTVSVGRPLWREDGSVFCICCCWSLSAQSFSGPSPLGLTTIFYCLRFETSLFVASYDSQGHGGGIRPRFHKGGVPNRGPRVEEFSCPLSWKRYHCCARNVCLRWCENNAYRAVAQQRTVPADYHAYVYQRAVNYALDSRVTICYKIQCCYYGEVQECIHQNYFVKNM